MCTFSHNRKAFTKSFWKPNRLAWDEYNFEKPPERAPARMDPKAARERLKREIAKGIPPPEPVRNPERSGRSIDPGRINVHAPTLEEKFPDLPDVIEKMRRIKSAQFDKVHTTETKSALFKNLEKFTQELEESLIYQAVVDNWDINTLLTVYSDKLYHIYHQGFSRPLTYSILGRTLILFDWLIKPEKRGMDGINPVVEKSPILQGHPEKKIKIGEHMKLMEESIRKRIDPPNNDLLAFAQKELIPFYRELIINRAVVTGASNKDEYDFSDASNTPQKKHDDIPDVINNEYAQCLADIYTTCKSRGYP